MANLRSTIAAALHVRPRDGWPLALLLVHSFFYGVSLVFIETPANTLFLARFSVKSLSYVYILTAVVSTLLGLGYSKLEARLPPARLLQLTLFSLSAATALTYGALLVFDSRWLVMGLMVWKDVQWVMSGVAFWALAGMLFDVRQGKRLFGLVGAGEVTAGILGGLSVPWIVQRLGTLSLVLMSSVATAASLGVLFYTLRRFAPRFAPAAGHAEQRDTRPLHALFKERFLALFFTLSVLSYISFYFIDYVFYDRVERAFPDEMKLASFFGIFFAALGCVELVTSTFLSGRLLTRYGVGFGLLALPAVDVFTVGVSLLFSLSAVFLWMVVATKLLDEVVRNSIQSPSFRTLYQPLPPGKRLRVQAMRESVLEPIALGVSGALLLLLTSVMSLGAVALLYVVLLLLAASITLSVPLRREYTAALVRALSKRRLRGEPLSLDDPSTMAALEKGLASPEAREVVYCLNLLEEENRHRQLLDKHLLRLLSHPAPEVREHVLVRVRRLRVAAAFRRVDEMAEWDPSPRVHGLALRALCALGDTAVVDRVGAFMEHPEPEVRKGALVGLLQSCGIDGVLIAGSHVQALSLSHDPAERGLAARVLGAAAIEGFYQPLLRLMADADPAVRKDAVGATGRVKNARLLPPVIERLGDAEPPVRESASRALVRFGEPAVPELEAAMKKPGQLRALRARFAEVCGRIGGHAAIRVLREHLQDAEETVRDRAMAALTMCKYHATGAEAAAVKQLVREEAADAAWALAAVADLTDEPVAAAVSAEAVASPDAVASAEAVAGPDRRVDTGSVAVADAPAPALASASGRVVEALLSQVRRSQDRVLTLLSFIYPGDSMLQSKLWLASESGEKRASALEVIDNLLATDVKALALPLLDDVTPRERLARLGANFPQPRLGPEARLREIVTRPHARSTCWTKACALYALGCANARGFDDAVVPSLGDPDPVVRETAAWVLFATGSAQYREQVQRLRNDPSRLVARAAERLESFLPTRGLVGLGGAARRTPARVDRAREEHAPAGRARGEGAGGQAVTEVPVVGASLGGEGLSGGLAGGEPPEGAPAGGKKE